MEHVVQLNIGVISKVLKLVDHALVTRISYIAGVGFSGLKNVKTCRFLTDHIYIYGLKSDEVELFIRFNVDEAKFVTNTIPVHIRMEI